MKKVKEGDKVKCKKDYLICRVSFRRYIRGLSFLSHEKYFAEGKTYTIGQVTNKYAFILGENGVMCHLNDDTYNEHFENRKDRLSNLIDKINE